MGEGELFDRDGRHLPLSGAPRRHEDSEAERARRAERDAALLRALGYR